MASTIFLTLWLLKYLGFDFDVRELVRSGCPVKLVCWWDEEGGAVCCSVCASYMRLEMRVFVAVLAVVGGVGALEGITDVGDDGGDDVALLVRRRVFYQSGHRDIYTL